MPDHLDDFLANSEPSRHKMMCPKCSEIIRGSTSLGVRLAMKYHRKYTCPVWAQIRREQNMSSPFDELIGALTLLKQQMNTPMELMKLTVDAEELQEAMEARLAIQQAMGMVPLPGDHPDFVAVTGAMGEAAGMIDNVNQVYQQVRQSASDAQASIQNVVYVIDSVIMGMQQGHQ